MQHKLVRFNRLALWCFSVNTSQIKNPSEQMKGCFAAFSSSRVSYQEKEITSVPLRSCQQLQEFLRWNVFLHVAQWVDTVNQSTDLKSQYGNFDHLLVFALLHDMQFSEGWIFKCLQKLQQPIVLRQHTYVWGPVSSRFCSPPRGPPLPVSAHWPPTGNKTLLNTTPEGLEVFTPLLTVKLQDICV